MQDFVHLHVHSEYSILDGQASIEKLVDKAIADNMKGIAITDHGNMMGIKEFFNYVNNKINAKKSGDERFSPSSAVRCTWPSAVSSTKSSRRTCVDTTCCSSPRTSRAITTL